MQIHVYFLFFILGLLDTNKLLAQTLLQINHIENRIDLTSHSELFIDSTGDKKIEQVISLHFKPLKEFSFPKKVIQNYKQHYWLRFGLLNTSPDTLNLLFTAGFHHHIRLYEPILIAESSQYLSKSDRPFYVDAKYLPIILPPLHQKVFYVEIKDLIDEGFEIKPALLTRSHAEHIKLYSIYDNQQLLFLNTGFIYILIFMGIFTLLQFYFSHEKYFLFYSLYLFSMSLFNYWGFSHVALISNFMTEFSFWRFSLRQEFYILLTNFFYFNFLYEFLQLRKIDKPFGLYLYRFKWIIFFFLLLDIVLTLIVRRLDWAFYAMFVAQIVLSAGGIITFYYLIKIKGTAVNFIKIGSLMLLFGAIIGYTAIYFDFYPSSNELFPYYPHLYFAILTLIEILFFSLGIGYKFLETTQQKTKLQKEIAESTLDVLRLQMNPHFIFNSLNSIKSYVLKERNIEAAQYLNDFAQLFRRVLNLSRDQIISLDEEIQTLKLYVILEQKRFQNRF
ncbi:MAG: histidine kinase [Runella sp.]